MRLIDADRLLKDMKICCERNCMKCRNATFLASDEHCGLIDDQPTANEWIPFNQENPPETGDYLITWTDGGAEYVDCVAFFEDSNWLKEFGHCVIAYMPKPKPYVPII